MSAAAYVCVFVLVQGVGLRCLERHTFVFLCAAAYVCVFVLVRATVLR